MLRGAGKAIHINTLVPLSHGTFASPTESTYEPIIERRNSPNTSAEWYKLRKREYIDSGSPRGQWRVPGWKSRR